MDEVEVLAEKEVTTQSLSKIFKRAFFSTTIDSDERLKVQSDGPQIIIKIDTEKKLITFLMFLGIKEGAPDSVKLDLVNTLNSNLILARFAIPHPKVITADYTLSFEEGIPTFQVVSTLRLFGRVVAGGVNVYDTCDIVL